MKYGLIGEHLKHSFSKEIHAKIGDYAYEIKEIAPEDLEEFFKKRDFSAINVTIPYKETIIKYLDEISSDAEKIGAVNTVVNKGGKLYGYNTDYYGMSMLIKKCKIKIRGKKVLILGTGGTSKTAHAVVNDMGALSILHVSRQKSESTITYDEAIGEHNNAEVIINTTPVGMFPNSENAPIDISHFKNLEGVIDAIYNPLKTNLILNAKKNKIKALGGLYILSAQGVRASEFFFDCKYPKSMLQNVYHSVLKEKENIVLVGMPSCGKTTTGKILAKDLGRKFVDTDDLIVEKIGMDIPTFFKEYGEEKFRDIESEVIAEISSQNGLIIATGGGAVLRYENVRRLKQNGKIYFINRPLDMLMPTASRPMSSDKEALKKRFVERYSLYKQSADIIIRADKTSKEAARKIKEEFFR